MHYSPVLSSLTVLDRYLELLPILTLPTARGLDRCCQRLASLALIPQSGPAEDLVERLATHAELLGNASALMGTSYASMRYGIASLLEMSGLSTGELLKLSAHDQLRLSRSGIVLEPTQVILATAIRCVACGPQEPGALVSLRTAHLLHDLNRGSGWSWTCRSLAVTMLLVHEASSQRDFSTLAADIYAQLRESGFPSGGPLVLASQLLLLSAATPRTIVDIFSELEHAFALLGSDVVLRHPENFAGLCLLPHTPDTIARLYLRLEQDLDLRTQPDGVAWSATQVADLTVLELLGATHLGTDSPRWQRDATAGYRLECLHRYQALVAICELPELFAKLSHTTNTAGL
jgi:hypothetical protein